MTISEMLDRNIHDRVLKVLEAEKRDWERVGTLRDWETFRAPDGVLWQHHRRFFRRGSRSIRA